MPSVVGEQGKSVMYRSRAYQEVKVFNAVSALSQSDTLHGEYPADRFFEWHYFIETIEKPLQSLFRALRIRGAVHAVVELGKRNDAQSNTLRQ